VGLLQGNAAVCVVRMPRFSQPYHRCGPPAISLGSIAQRARYPPYRGGCDVGCTCSQRRLGRRTRLPGRAPYGAVSPAMCRRRGQGRPGARVLATYVRVVAPKRRGGMSSSGCCRSFRPRGTPGGALSPPSLSTSGGTRGSSMSLSMSPEPRVSNHGTQQRHGARRLQRHCGLFMFVNGRGDGLTS